MPTEAANSRVRDLSRASDTCRPFIAEEVPETAQRVVNDFCSAVSGSAQTTARARTSRLNTAFAAAPQDQHAS